MERTEAIEHAIPFLVSLGSKLTHSLRDDAIKLLHFRTGVKKSSLSSDLDAALKKTRQTEAQNATGVGSVKSSGLLIYAEGGEFFHTSTEEVGCRIKDKGRYQIYMIGRKNSPMGQYLITCYYRECGAAPEDSKLTEALGTLRARAKVDGISAELCTRIGWKDSSIYVDLANEAGDFVEINAKGWRVSNGKCPVFFRRTPGTQSLPVPVGGGSLRELLRFLNISDPKDGNMILGWLIGVMSRGPYGHLTLRGHRGSAKTTVTRLLKSLIDPHDRTLAELTTDQKSLGIAARNSHILTFDNLSDVSNKQSDWFCRLSTGGGLTARRLYTDDDEIVMKFRRPAILNSIVNLVTRGDLSQRCITITLPPFEGRARLTEAELDEDFQRLHPRLLGALLDAVSMALRNLPNISAADCPRLLDFSLFMDAAAPALGLPSDYFRNALIENQRQSAEIEMDENVIVHVLKHVFDKKISLSGGQKSYELRASATNIWIELSKVAKEILPVSSSSWPNSTIRFSSEFSRIEPQLADQGIRVIRTRGHRGSRLTIITYDPTKLEGENTAERQAA